MCGLAGYLMRRAHGGVTADDGTIRRMTDTMHHRGPDSSDVWCDAEAGVALGHRRLAIIDLSSEGAQPMTSADGRYVMTYNGEVYNFRELRKEMEELGHRFRGYSDSEVMLATICEWGLATAVRRFIGMFAIALWDRQTRRLSLVRDRLGIKPLYYAITGDAVIFGSELRSLRAFPGFRGDIDREALTLYLMRNCIPAPWTIFQQARKLLPATIMTVGGDLPEPKFETYWSLREVAEFGSRQPFTGSIEEAVDQAECVLSEAVHCRMVADVPLGVFLSGGVDSSAVAALMQSVSDQPVKTFSIGFRDAGYDEAGDARAVAKHLGTAHHELYLDEQDALDVVPHLGAMYDEPFGDSSQIPTYLVSKMAREHVTVALSGDGGDEMFGGYNRYLWVDGVARMAGRLPGWGRNLAANLMTAVAPATWDRLAGLLRQRTPGDKLHKLAGVLRAGDEPGIYEALVRHWQTAEQVVIGSTPPTDLVHRRQDWADLPDFVRQMKYLDAMTYLPDDILTKVDRASMAVSLEARVPLIDHRVVAFAWSLPMSMKIDGGVGKQALRRVLYRHVPRALIERPKMGFAVPIHEWLRGPLRDWAEDLLSERRLRDDGFFDPAPIRETWAEHLSGRFNRQHQLWDVLMFQAWRQAGA